MSTVNSVSEKYELGFIRIFDAPVSAVWRAWADPEMFGRWWGPMHYTSHANKLDFHLGGKFLWNTRSPEGRDYFSAGIYREVIPNKRIVISHYLSDASGNPVPASYYDLPGNWPVNVVITITFDDFDGKTRMALHETGIPEDIKEETVKGWNESLDKLAEVLG